MWRLLRRLIVFGPAALAIGVVACHGVDAVKVGRHFADPASVGWGEGDSAVRVKVSEIEKGESSTLRLEAFDADGERLADRSLDVDRDMWGGGFALAMQADDDPALEVVAWGAHEPNDACFYFDYANGAVEVRSFDAASAPARSLALRRHQVQGVDAGVVSVLTFLVFVYYIGLALAWLVIRVARRLVNRPASSPPLGEGK